ncbi:NYN domain limkain-b1-type [Arabidopsis thaliana x Arabidopsis arenosa]|uniref:NYN domain limkain-b1-type n=1 Tax=Arabidopsis thaliana x Arabidopsis arenosa TaxID=1240361 RepID=A0A8T2D1A3_9BRAS|nr:NYN domain limkain-b1-type [Arabidopsis thaliana x Arabidopsis arenosa]
MTDICMLKTMDSRNMNEAKQEPKTMVWWDINSCPVPDGYDARMVAHSIESELKKAGYSGPLTITAIGYLNYTLKRTPGVLQAISSTGILLKNVLNDFRYVLEDLSSWAFSNRTPATLIFISGADAYSASISTKFSLLRRLGHTIHLAYPQHASFPFHSGELLWESLLKDGMNSGELLEKCCEMDESAWLCSICRNSCLTKKQNLPVTKYSEFLTLKGDRSFQGKSYEDFTTHLKSTDHALCELNTAPRPITHKLANLTEWYYYQNHDTTMVKKQSKKRSFEEVEEKEQVEEEVEEKEEDEEEEENQYWDDDEWERLTV